MNKIDIIGERFVEACFSKNLKDIDHKDSQTLKIISSYTKNNISPLIFLENYFFLISGTGINIKITYDTSKFALYNLFGNYCFLLDYLNYLFKRKIKHSLMEILYEICPNNIIQKVINMLRRDDKFSSELIATNYYLQYIIILYCSYCKYMPRAQCQYPPWFWVIDFEYLINFVLYFKYYYNFYIMEELKGVTLYLKSEKQNYAKFISIFIPHELASIITEYVFINIFKN